MNCIFCSCLLYLDGGATLQFCDLGNDCWEDQRGIPDTAEAFRLDHILAVRQDAPITGKIRPEPAPQKGPSEEGIQLPDMPRETACTRATVDEAVAIDEVKRFIADRDLDAATRYIPPVSNPQVTGCQPIANH